MAFLCGALSGAQGVYDRYGRDAGRAVRTWPGIGYLIVRGCIPAAVFTVGYYSGTLQHLLPLEAASVGFGTEVFLRSRFYIAKRSKGGAAPEELLWGPLNFMRWLQGYFLEEARTRITLKRRKIVEKHIDYLVQRLSDASFSKVCKIVMDNSLAYGTEAGERKTKDSVLVAVAELQREYIQEEKKSPADGERESRYIRKLAYWIFHNADGTQGLELLLKPRA